MDDRREETALPRARVLRRRELFKLGTSVVATTLAAQRASAQGRGRQAPPPAGSMTSPDGPRPHTGAGYNNDYDRLAGNGPMDDNTRKIVNFVHGFNESNLTSASIQALNPR